MHKKAHEIAILRIVGNSGQRLIRATRVSANHSPRKQTRDQVTRITNTTCWRWNRVGNSGHVFVIRASQGLRPSDQPNGRIWRQKWCHLAIEPFRQILAPFGAIYLPRGAILNRFKVSGISKKVLLSIIVALSSPPPEQGTPERASVPETSTKQHSHPLIPQTNLTPTYLHSVAILHIDSELLS